MAIHEAKKEFYNRIKNGAPTEEKQRETLKKIAMHKYGISNNIDQRKDRENDK